MELPDRTQAKSWEGRDVADRSGQALGRCVGVFADTATGVAEWLDVDVEGQGRRFVPAIEATDTEGTVRVRFSRDQVVSAPTVGDDVQLSKAEEIELYQHYGVPVETSGSGSLLPKEVGDANGTSDASTTTSTEVSSTGGTADGGTAAGLGTAAAVAGTSAEVGSADTTRAPADTGTTGDGTDRLDTATEGLGPADAVPSGPVETGEDLPVLDPSAASTPVPEDQVTYVDEPEGFATDEPAAAPAASSAAAAAPPAAATPEPEPTPALPPPTLRRVGQTTTPAPAPTPAPPPRPAPAASSGGGSDLSGVTPLGVLAAGVAAVALVLRAREARQRRRNAPAARADRLRKHLQTGSSAALASAGSTLSGASEAAAHTRRQAADAATKVAREAAREAARRKASASTSTSRTTRRQKRQAAAALAKASRTAQQRKRQAAASVAAASSAVSEQRRAAAASVSKASSSASRRRSRTTRAAATVPTRVVRRGRKARKSVARKLWDLVVLSAAGGGYVMGAKAGRERYDELGQVASAVAASPQVQSATAAVKDPERRADLLVEVQQQAASLFGRRSAPRG